MGDSDKLPDSGPGSYRFVEHRRYLDALLEALDVHERITFVILTGDHWDKLNMRPVLKALRTEAGEAKVMSVRLSRETASVQLSTSGQQRQHKQRRGCNFHHTSSRR